MDRCVHIGDRGSDIHELFCLACEPGTHFLTRTCVDRLAGDAGHPALAVGYACKFYPPPPPIVAWTESRCFRTASAAASGSRCHRARSEEHTSELQSLMRISYAVFCLKQKTTD